MRILCLPIDSRPCNTQFIRRLVSWAGHELVLPDQTEMDDFRRPAPFAGSAAFLKRELPRCGAAVISLDHWCYGSLLASREDTVSEDEALKRVQELKDLLGAHPEIPVYMSSVILRSTISAFSQQDMPAYLAMIDYSVAADRLERFGLNEDREKLENARALIPEPVLRKALDARRRNLRVNLSAVEMAAEGIVRSLSVLQEDCQVYGLPRKDQRAIEEHIRKTGAQSVFLRNGTDEAGALSAALAMRAGREKLPVDIRFWGNAGFIAPFEDRPFMENMESACREAGIVPCENSGTVICVCCPEDESRGASETLQRQYAAQADALVREGKRVYLLDLIVPNGGSTYLVESLKEADGLWGYSAWNTASNAMGTLLAQVISDALRGRPNRAYYQERLLDDWLYQTVIRPQLTERLEERGENIFDLARKERAEELLSALFQKEVPARWPLAALPRYRVSLPWNRVFEAAVTVEE